MVQGISHIRGRIYTDYEVELRHAIKLYPFYERLIDSISLKNKVVLDLGCGQANVGQVRLLCNLEKF